MSLSPECVMLQNDFSPPGTAVTSMFLHEILIQAALVSCLLEELWEKNLISLRPQPF